ncbi:MAG: chemotaxis protein CheW [Promethearchaeota archaeon]
MYAKNIHSSESVQLIVFKLGTEEFGLEITQVKEIVKHSTSNIIKVPNVPDFIEGIMNLRGDILVVMELRKRFNMRIIRKGSHILIVDTGLFQIGMIIDSVTEVLHLPTEFIEPVPIDLYTQNVSREYLLGIGKVDNGKRLIILVDLNKLFSDTELEELDEIYKNNDKIRRVIIQKTKEGIKKQKKASITNTDNKETLKRTKQMNIENLKQRMATEERNTIQRLAVEELMREMNIESIGIVEKSQELKEQCNEQIQAKPIKKSEIQPKREPKNQKKSEKAATHVNLDDLKRKLNVSTKKKLVAFLKSKKPEVYSSGMRKRDLINAIVKNVPVKEISIKK